MIEGDINDFIELPVVYLTKEGLVELERLEEARRILTQERMAESERDLMLPFESRVEYSSFTEIDEEVNKIYATPGYAKHIVKYIRLRDIADYEPHSNTEDMSFMTLYNDATYTVNAPLQRLCNLINDKYGNI